MVISGYEKKRSLILCAIPILFIIIYFVNDMVFGGDFHDSIFFHIFGRYTGLLFIGLMISASSIYARQIFYSQGYVVVTSDSVIVQGQGTLKSADIVNMEITRSYITRDVLTIHSRSKKSLKVYGLYAEASLADIKNQLVAILSHAEKSELEI